MGMLVKYIQRHPSGRCNYRRAFPPELQAIIGRREHKSPLGREGSAGFLTRYEQAARNFEETVDLAERKLAGSYDALDAPLIAYLAEALLVDHLEDDEASRWDQSDLALYKSVRADLAQRGINVAEHAVVDGLMNKASVVASGLMSEARTAEMHRKQAEPGSAKD